MLSRKLTGGWFRRLWHGDEDALLAHYRRLSPNDRRSRFLHTVSGGFLERQVLKLREPGYCVIGWFLDGVLRGVVEIAVQDGAAEAGFSVEETWRNIGVGDGLMRRALRRARRAGCRSLTVLTSWDNGPMIRLARGYDARLRAVEGEVVGELTPARTSWAELSFEQVDDRLGLIAGAAEVVWAIVGASFGAGRAIHA
jgi:GNAT superfamily N-acetyltransferase